MDSRDWIRDGIRAVAGGVLAIPLAITNIPLFLAGLALTPVLGIGLVLLPLVTLLIRARADLGRRLAAGRGVMIARPYRPRPERAVLGGLRYYRWLITDPATWRDVAWLLPGAVAGLALGVLALAVPVYGIKGILLIPLWVWLATDHYGYGAIWPIETLGDGFLSLPQGALILAIGIAAAPYLRQADALFNRVFLAPTRAAELSLRVSQLTVTRADTVDAQAAELRRIERDLHDGAQARLVALGMTIGLAEEIVDADPATARKLLAEARETSSAALVELRHLVRGIHPPVLAERGLEGAVRALTMALPVPSTVTASLPGRLDTPVESAAYFAVAEVLANAVRHSVARNTAVELWHTGQKLFLRASDDGRGRSTGRHRAARHRAPSRRLRWHDEPVQPAGRTDCRDHGAAVRVVLAEDLALLRDGLTRLLEAFDFEVVAAVDNGPSLLPALLEHRPDVAVVDVRLPPTFTDEGLQAAIEARRKVPGMPVLVLSQHVEPLYARELLTDRAGGVGYLLKDRVANVAQFVDAVRRVAAGGTAMDPEVVGQLLARNRSPLSGLTGREREVLGLMAEGRSNGAIAAKLFVGEKAVSKHISSIFTKLGLPPSVDDHRRVLAVLAYFDV
jgi:DNA-binding NarL/FixJ family response regulator/signal transduction histidine kinase